MKIPNNLKGTFPSAVFSTTRYRATGEKRCPLKGEYYLSGAEIAAYKVLHDLTTEFWIAVPVTELVLTLTVDSADHAGKIVDAVRALTGAVQTPQNSLVFDGILQDLTTELGICLRQFGATVTKAQVK